MVYFRDAFSAPTGDMMWLNLQSIAQGRKATAESAPASCLPEFLHINKGDTHSEIFVLSRRGKKGKF